MKEEQEPLLARKIPPKIAEAVAGMELVGAELVDRKTILDAIAALRGDSYVERLAEKLSRSIGESALESMSRALLNSMAMATEEALKSSHALANSIVNKNALSGIAKIFESSMAMATEEAKKSSHALANSIVNKDALESMTKAFESSGFKAVEEAARNSQAMMDKIVDTSALDSMTKAFESSGFKAVEEAARNSQAMMDRLATLNVAKTFKFESEMLDRIIRQMSDTGWLIPTDTRGIWEFAPGSRAGSFQSSNTFMPLKAALTKRPDLQVAVTMESAAFLHRLSEHSPRKGVIAVPKGTARKGSLARYRHVNVQLPASAISYINDIPVHTISGLLVAMSMRPLSYRDWPNVRKWLPIACNRIITASNEEPGSLGGEGGLLSLLQDQSTAVIARVAYFFRVSQHDPISRRILAIISEPYEGPIYLGSRDSVGMYASYDSVTKVYDNLIEFK